jgi:hypothetical protein
VGGGFGLNSLGGKNKDIIRGENKDIIGAKIRISKGVRI